MLRAALNLAHEKKVLIDRPPIIKSISWTKCEEEKAVTAIFTADQIRQLISYARADEPLFRFILLAIATEGRPDAVRELTPAQIDFEAGLIHLNPEGRKQTKKYRATVRMPEALRPYLLKWIRDDRLEPDDAFIRVRLSLPFSMSHPCLHIKWNRAVKSKEGLGLKGRYVTKSLRHTMASWLRAQRVSEKDRSIQLGHARAEHSNKMTRIYERDFDDPEYLTDACAAINAYLEQVLSPDPADTKVVSMRRPRKA
jgi:integrase